MKNICPLCEERPEYSDRTTKSNGMCYECRKDCERDTRDYNNQK